MGGAGNWLRGGRAQTKKERVGRLPVAGLLSRPRLGTPPRGRSPQDGRDSQTCGHRVGADTRHRSEEHTSELQSPDLHSFPPRPSSDLTSIATSTWFTPAWTKPARWARFPNLRASCWR